MTLTKRNGSLINQLPMLFDDLFSRDYHNFALSNFSDTNTTIPATNIKETPDAYEVEVAAPGMSKKDFKIELDGHTLTINSTKTTESENKENERYTKREFSYQSFFRSFNLQKDVVDIEKIQAKYEDGILHIHVPKREEVKPKPARQIEVS